MVIRWIIQEGIPAIRELKAKNKKSKEAKKEEKEEGSGGGGGGPDKDPDDDKNKKDKEKIHFPKDKSTGIATSIVANEIKNKIKEMKYTG